MEFGKVNTGTRKETCQKDYLLETQIKLWPCTSDSAYAHRHMHMHRVAESF